MLPREKQSRVVGNSSPIHCNLDPCLSGILHSDRHIEEIMTYVQEVHAAFWKCFVGGLVILTVALLFRQRAAGGQPQFLGCYTPGATTLLPA